MTFKRTRAARLALSACSLVGAAGFAASTAEITRTSWRLFSGSNALTSHPSEADCVDAAKALNATRSYSCRTSTTVAVTYASDATTGCTGTRPQNESLSVACPSGSTNSWTQSRTYGSAPYPTCWAAGPWLPESPPSGACDALASPSPPTTGESVGTWSAANLQASGAFRVSMASGSYPVWVTGGATHTHLPSGAWDGSGAARLTPPTADQSYSAIGGFGNLSRGGSYPLRSLNVRFELRLGPTWASSNAVGDPKFMIVHTSSTAAGATSERPMAYLAPSSPCTVFAVAAGTVKQFNHAGTSPDWWPSGREAFRFCDAPQAGGKPVVLPGEWVSVELFVVAEPRPSYPSGAIRTVVTRRNGTVLLDYFIPWTYDANWSLPKFITEVQVIGGYFNAGNAANAGNYMDIAGLTFAANRTTVLGPRAGFLQ